MSEDRKAAILRAVVQEYIESANPVGSGRVADRSGIDVSTATIRNELVLLEEEGFLVQPHTSAGRITTEKAYRFFVDGLPGPGQLEAADREQVSAFFARSHSELELMLRDTSTLLSDLTGSPAVVLAPARAHQEIRSLQLVGLGPHLALLVIVMANGAVEKLALEFTDDVHESTLAIATAHLSGAIIGRHMSDAPEPLRTGDPAVDHVFGAALALLADRVADLEEAFVGGAARVADVFDDVGLVQQVLNVLERQYLVVGLLRDVLDRGLSVVIGTETRVEPLNECSLVVAPYEIDGDQVGSIAVLGPTRMNYPQALATVAVVSRRLGDRLTSG
ncbi:MAG: heat-inducible transcriptional repressor HrcA [Acidimicrobiales bacterium]|nr:heat-inducible transcriptional repressor HrcA [Acidimicrobiales bacterium]